MMRTVHSYDAETKQRAVSFVEQGIRIMDVAENLNIPYATIKTWVNKKMQQDLELSQGKEKSRDSSDAERSRAENGFSLKERLAVVRRVREGYPMKQVANERGIGLDTLRKWMKKEPIFKKLLKIPPARRGRPKTVFSTEKKLEAVSRIKQGEAVRDIAREFCTSFKLVQNWYRTLGNLKKKSTFDLDTKLRAYEMLRQGKDVEEVAATMDIGAATVKAWNQHPVLKRLHQNKLRREKYKLDKMKQAAESKSIGIIKVDAKKQHALKQLESGCQPAEVASRLQLPLFTVIDWRREMQKISNRISYPLEYKLKAIEESAIGMSNADIARALNVTSSTVKYWLDRKQQIQKLGRQAAKQKSKKAGPQKRRPKEVDEEESEKEKEERETEGKTGRIAKKTRHRTLVKNPMSMRLTRPEFSDKVLTSILVDFGFEEGEVQEWMDRKRGRGKVANNNNRRASSVDSDAAERPSYAVDPFDEDASEQELKQILNGASSDDGEEENNTPITNYCHVTYEEALKMCKA